MKMYQISLVNKSSSVKMSVGFALYQTFSPLPNDKDEKRSGHEKLILQY